MERPNVIVIFTDDHGFTDLSCQGVADDVKTPHIDFLAEHGVRMTSGYVTAPQCVPSRAGLLSGRYQNRFGVESNGEPLEGFNAQQTIAERLREAGYATGMTGKWHLGPQAEITSHGFDDVYFKNANRPGWANFDLNGNDRPGGVEDSKLYHLDVNSRAAAAFIDRHHDQPFFFYCAYRAPHVPLDAPPRYLQRFPGEMPERRRQALAMLSAVDDGVGQIMEQLRQHNIEDRTLIFLIGDNGAPLKIHKLDAPGGGPGWDGSLNDPLNGEKGMLSEGGIRVPFVAYWKDHLPAGIAYDHPVISLDVAATAIALAGLPEETSLDGVNLIPYLQAESRGAPHSQLYWRWIAQSAIREGKWKYLRGGKREYLFDLESDQEEQKNLAPKHPELVQTLRRKLEDWSNGLKPPGLTTNTMSSTWEQYYDHYLDGKLVSPARTTQNQNRGSTSEKIQGWVVRNGTASTNDQQLQIRPHPASRKQPFVAVAGLDLPRQFQVRIRQRSSSTAKMKVAWRADRQSDFPAEQVGDFLVQKTEDASYATAVVASPANVIHLRVILPKIGADIESIEVWSTENQLLRQWRFDD